MALAAPPILPSPHYPPIRLPSSLLYTTINIIASHDVVHHPSVVRETYHSAELAGNGLTSYHTLMRMKIQYMMFMRGIGMLDSIHVHIHQVYLPFLPLLFLLLSPGATQARKLSLSLDQPVPLVVHLLSSSLPRRRCRLLRVQY